MTIHVASLQTEVAAEAPESAPVQPALRGMEWEERFKIAAHRARLQRDEIRTRAAGYDD